MRTFGGSSGGRVDAARDEPWWLRLATSDGRAGPQQWGGVLVLFVTHGEMTLRIAGYSNIDLREGEAAIISSRLWVRATVDGAHSIALAYRAETSARRTRLARRGDMLVASGPQPHMPGASAYVSKQARLREADEERRKELAPPLAPQQPAPWVHTNKPMIHVEDVARQEAKREADEGRAIAKQAAAEAKKKERAAAAAHAQRQL
jgi:hypothetical protein